MPRAISTPMTTISILIKAMMIHSSVFDLSVANIPGRTSVLLDQIQLELDLPETISESRTRLAGPPTRPHTGGTSTPYSIRSRMPILAITSVNSVLFSATNRNKDLFPRAENTPVLSTELLSRVNASSIASVFAA